MIIGKLQRVRIELGIMIHAECFHDSLFEVLQLKPVNFVQDWVLWTDYYFCVIAFEFIKMNK